MSNRVNFQYDGRTSKYNLEQLQELLPFHGALSALFRIILDMVIDEAYASDKPKDYIAKLISRREFSISLVDKNGNTKRPENVNYQP